MTRAMAGAALLGATILASPLNTATAQCRFRGGAVSPDGKLFYTVTKEIVKFPEHFEVGKAKYTVIDLTEQKIVRTADM